MTYDGVFPEVKAAIQSLPPISMTYNPCEKESSGGFPSNEQIDNPI